MKPVLNGTRILLSASVPPELENEPGAVQAHSDMVILTRAILEMGGHLLFGGHPSITRLVWKAAKTYGHSHGLISIFQARFFEKMVPPEVHDQEIFGPVQWIGSGTDREGDLQIMRRTMCSQADAAIFVGGIKQTGGIGKELKLYQDLHDYSKPYYLLPNWGGETKELIEMDQKRGKREINGLDAQTLHLIHQSPPFEFSIFIILKDILCRKKT